MKKWFIILGLLLSFNWVISQPCIKCYNYMNGTWIIYNPEIK